MLRCKLSNITAVISYRAAPNLDGLHFPSSTPQASHFCQDNSVTLSQ